MTFSVEEGGVVRQSNQRFGAEIKWSEVSPTTNKGGKKKRCGLQKEGRR